MSHIVRYGVFLRRHPLWWLLPPALILTALYVLVRFGGDGSVAGFVYDV
jgi:hypothetical protein